MKQIIELYINGKLVEFGEDFSINFTYQLEDFDNPSAIKNAFTKTIKIEGTPSNNKIFDEIYHLDRFQTPSELQFNPSQRTPFVMYKNGELVEDGYMQLTSIEIENKKINYNVNLYGGLGDFFYNLSYKKNANEDEEVEMTLKDLYFEIEDEQGYILPSEDEMNFKMNIDFVSKCLENPMGRESNKLYDVITFIPAYNGVPSNFSADKVYVNYATATGLHVSDQPMETTAEEDGTTYKYSTYHGVVMANLPNPLTEWQVRDLRTYLQRPGLRLRKFFEAISNPINNGGYKVELDYTFFNQGNRLYDRAFIALPLLTFPDDIAGNKTNTIITKEMLLSSDITPFNFLVDYCKMFGLYFEKKLNEKTILIKTRNNFFVNKITDISDKIDYSKKLTIQPTLFQNKYYRFANEAETTYLSDKYEKKYNKIYGQKRINTNYNFNSEVVEVFEDFSLKNAITYLDNSPYYYNYYNKHNNMTATWLIENPTFTLYKWLTGAVDYTSTQEKEITSTDWVSTRYSKPINSATNYEGLDKFAKICFFEQNDKQQSPSSLANCLVIYNGDEFVGDTNLWLTDDTDGMYLLNDNQPCWIYTESEIADAVSPSQYAKKLTLLPQFTRYDLRSNTVYQSLDFALPSEIYTKDTIYNDYTTIYYNYFKKLYTEQLNYNTKKVTCNVNLNDIVVNSQLLKQFYYFDNSIWVINKIENYSPNSYNTTKVEFVKVNDIKNYTEGQNIDFQYFELSNDRYIVPFNATTLTTEIYASNNWYINDFDVVTDITPYGSDSGNYTLSFQLPENNEYNVKNGYISLMMDNEYNDFEQVIRIQQLPNPSTTTMIYGRCSMGTIKIYDEYNSFQNTIEILGNTYKLYAPKGKKLIIEYIPFFGFIDWKTEIEPVYTDTFEVNIE